uniref:chitinase n=1 Tax=Pseudotsuga menziesii TaxID=3357 RepID=D7P706_PSEMZ|nr:class II chitinase 2-3 [Pseudotsuga menziesii]
MANTDLRMSVITLWLALALSALSICLAAVGDIATQDFFNGILSGASDTCAGKTFYTYSDFITAANAFSAFGTTGTSDDQKREIAAFFANAAHETTSLCYIEEINKTNNYCDSNNTQYPCASDKYYYGRGPLQLTWNYNYGAAGDYLGVDLLKNPETVAQDDLTSWKAALWFWNVNTGSVGTTCHAAITSGQGFGETIQIINGGVECNGGSTSSVQDRVSLYTNYCSQLGVDPGSNPSC